MMAFPPEVELATQLERRQRDNIGNSRTVVTVVCVLATVGITNSDPHPHLKKTREASHLKNGAVISNKWIGTWLFIVHFFILLLSMTGPLFQNVIDEC